MDTKKWPILLKYIKHRWLDEVTGDNVRSLAFAFESLVTTIVKAKTKNSGKDVGSYSSHGTMDRGG